MGVSPPGSFLSPRKHEPLSPAPARRHFLFMKFYVVTPCFNALRWLQCCVRSVADQIEGGIEVHHHVQDAASTDGSPEWLKQWQREHADTPGYTFTYESAKDAGMYDAINKAWERMPQDADITAHLNADEQYLPHALKGIADAYARYPKAEIIEGTYIITDAEGHYRCHRRPVQPHKWTSMRVCELITCSTFHRADVFRRHGIRFDTRFRVYGDVVFYRDIVCAGIRVVTVPQLITTTFAMTGGNLAWAASSRAEAEQLNDSTPAFFLTIFPLSSRYTGLRRFLVDMFCPPPRSYSLYKADSQERAEEQITAPTCRWAMKVGF